jgi:DNA-binding CsgD family transcriptional regulator
MVNKTDSLRGSLRALQDKTLENALAHRIEKEFPRIGGPRIRKLCAQMILEVVHQHIRSADGLKHGQVLWTAVSKDHPPAWRQRIADTDLVTVILDLSTPEDLKSRIDRVPETQRKLHKALRLCHQAYEQGGLLTNVDLSELLNIADSWIGRILRGHERQSRKIVPRRATLHDAGSGLTHKWIICYKRFVEGKSPDQIARETYHSLEAVDRYLSQYDRVRHCRLQGLSAVETAHILACGVSLVQAYRQIDIELEGKDT